MPQVRDSRAPHEQIAEIQQLSARFPAAPGSENCAELFLGDRKLLLQLRKGPER
jgi:hypothetical protein